MPCEHFLVGDLMAFTTRGGWWIFGEKRRTEKEEQTVKCASDLEATNEWQSKKKLAEQRKQRHDANYINLIRLILMDRESRGRKRVNLIASSWNIIYRRMV